MYGRRKAHSGHTKQKTPVHKAETAGIVKNDRSVNYFEKGFEEWLGVRDSNLDKQSQSLLPPCFSTFD
jgi:hypothetical protein